MNLLARHSMVGSMGRVGAARDKAAMESFFRLLLKNALDRQLFATRGPAHRHLHLDRTHLPPAQAQGLPWPIDSHRFGDNHDPISPQAP